MLNVDPWKLFASEQGLFNDKTVLRDFLTTISKNLHVKKQGKRTKVSTKLFFEVVLIWGDPRLATFVTSNVWTWNTLSLYGKHNRDHTTLEGGINRADMSKTAVFYKESIAKQFNNKTSLVLVLAAEDETAVFSKVTYSQEKFELLGFCGIKGANHQCLDQFKFTVEVGDKEEGYNTIFSAFRNNVIGNYPQPITFKSSLPSFTNHAHLQPFWYRVCSSAVPRNSTIVWGWTGSNFGSSDRPQLWWRFMLL